VWRLAAVESRPTEGAAPPSNLPVRRHMLCHTRARIRGGGTSLNDQRVERTLDDADG